jgi:hypothetical protein
VPGPDERVQGAKGAVRVVEEPALSGHVPGAGQPQGCALVEARKVAKTGRYAMPQPDRGLVGENGAAGADYERLPRRGARVVDDKQLTGRARAVGACEDPDVARWAPDRGARCQVRLVGVSGYPAAIVDALAEGELVPGLPPSPWWAPAIQHTMAGRLSSTSISPN